ADRDHGGVDQAHAGGEYFADVSPSLTNGLDRLDVASLDQVDDLRTVLGFHPGLAKCPGDGWPGCHGLQASAVATVAGHPGTTRDLHVADVAGDPLSAALQEPTGDDAGPDSRGDLHEDQVLGLRPRERAFAERHDVDVVVDEHGYFEVLLHPAGHIEAVPARHDGRVDGLAAAVLHRAGQSDSDRDEVLLVVLDALAQPTSGIDHPAEHLLRPFSDVVGLVDRAQSGAGEVGDGEGRV